MSSCAETGKHHGVSTAESAEAPQQLHNPLMDIVRERFSGLEADLRPVTAITIDGLRGSGVTTTSLQFAELVKQETGTEPVRYSFEEELRKAQELYDGNQPPAEIQRLVDRKIAMEMLNPDNSGRLVIVEGGNRMALIAKFIQLAGADLQAQGEIAEFPAHLMTAFIFGDEATRASRTQEINTEADALNEIWQVYPQLRGQNIFGINHLLGERLQSHDLFYDSQRETSMGIARNMYDSLKSELLPFVTPSQQSV